MESRILNDLRWLIKERSVNREEPLQLKLARELKGLEFRVHLQYVAPGRPNLLAVRGERPTLLILTHADTFPASDHEHPWELKVDDHGTAKGRGVLDAKGQIAAALEAFRLTDADVAFSTVVDEEVDGRGSLYLELPDGVEAAVVLEPTDLRPAVAQAGFLEVEAEIPGQSRHGSMPNDGENAIVRAWDFLATLRSLPFTTRYHPRLGYPRMNLEMMEGGGQKVVVPHRCRLRIDIQVPPGLTSREVERQVCLAGRAYGGKLAVVDRAEPFEVSLESRIYQLMARAISEELAREVEPVGMPSWTDAANLVAKGVPCVVFGAGNLSVAHTDREEVSLRDLTTMANVLARLLRLWNCRAP